MGGFYVEAQEFGIYQAIDWISREETSFRNRVNGVRRIRKIIEKGKADSVIRLGIVSRLAELLEKTKNDEIQGEIIWTLANIAAGPSRHTKLIMNKCTEIFLSILKATKSIEVKKNIILAFGNIAGDNAGFRDNLLNAGVMSHCLTLLSELNSLEAERNYLWLLSNLCRHKDPYPKFMQISECVPILKAYLDHSDEEILNTACWSFNYISHFERSAVLDKDTISKFVKLLSHQSKKIVASALVVCNNVASETVDEIQMLVDCGILKELPKLLYIKDVTILNRVFILISYITAKGITHIQSLVDNNILEDLINIFKENGDYKQEILYLIKNLICNGDENQINYALSIGCIDILFEGLIMSKEICVNLAIESFLNLIIEECNFDINIYVFKDIAKRLLDFQNNKNQDIGKLVRAYSKKFLYECDQTKD